MNSVAACARWAGAEGWLEHQKKGRDGQEGWIEQCEQSGTSKGASFKDENRLQRTTGLRGQL